MRSVLLAQNSGQLFHMHHQLPYEEDDESPPDHSPEDDILACQLPSITEEEDNYSNGNVADLIISTQTILCLSITAF